MNIRKSIISYSICSFIIFLTCCDKNGGIEDKSSPSEYAKKFSIIHFNQFDLLKVKNPWQKAQGVEISYVLAESKSFVPDSLSQLPFIQTPVKSAIVFSTTHIGFLKVLSKEAIVTGASGANYIFDPALRSDYEEGKISEVGYPPAINFEKILEKKPDVVFLYGIESTIGNISKRIESADIPTILIADFLEQHPLGKAEWIKVFASLTGTKRIADSIFSCIKTNYGQLCDSVNIHTRERPSVLLGLPWKDTWYMAGGQSFTSRLISDAGANYLWGENNSTEFIPLSVEGVMSKALKADFWLNPGSARSLDEITGRDNRYSIFAAYQRGNAYNNDKQLSTSESNNFWEEGVVQPDIILKDLIKIFHPELMNEHDFVYYRKLK